MFKKYIHNTNNKLFLILSLFFVLSVFLVNKLSNFPIYNKSVQVQHFVNTSSSKLNPKIRPIQVSCCHTFKHKPISQNQLPLKSEIILEDIIEDSENDPDNNLIPSLKKGKQYIIQELIINSCIKNSRVLFNAHKSIKTLNLLFCIFRI